jgi:hypothetical protein
MRPSGLQYLTMLPITATTPATKRRASMISPRVIRLIVFPLLLISIAKKASNVKPPA